VGTCKEKFRIQKGTIFFFLLLGSGDGFVPGEIIEIECLEKFFILIILSGSQEKLKGKKEL
jgi:hypothetical protein